MAVTLKDIAEKIGVSITTVSRGLAGYNDVAPSTKERIRQTAQELGYRPNITAQRLRKQRTDTIGFIIPSLRPRLSDPFFSDFLAGLGNEAALHNYDLLISTHPPYSERELETYRRAASGGWVDGVVIVRTRERDARIALMQESDIPFVVFGRTQTHEPYTFVDEDSHEGMRQLVQHFIDLGHRRIAFISPPKELMFSVYRQQGYLDTMAQNGLPVQPEWIIEGDLTKQGGKEAVPKLLQLASAPTAIIAGNDLMALGAMESLKAQGLQVGKDIALAGFDNVPMSAYVSPSLTTLGQPTYEIGQQTCQMLLDLINGRSHAPSHKLLTPTLIIRESSGSPIRPQGGL